LAEWKPVGWEAPLDVVTEVCPGVELDVIPVAEQALALLVLLESPESGQGKLVDSIETLRPPLVTEQEIERQRELAPMMVIPAEPASAPPLEVDLLGLV
jgi:hypothetical protein